MNENENRKHWIIRVGDGKNFINSKYAFWGVNRGCGNGFKTIIKKMKSGDILWFLTNKKFGGKIIGMSEYKTFYDKQDEPLIQINTMSNTEQNWIGYDNWDIQIHYINLYNTQMQNIYMIIQCSATILEYSTFRNRIKNHDLHKHYECFKFYSECIKKEEI